MEETVRILAGLALFARWRNLLTGRIGRRPAAYLRSFAIHNGDGEVAGVGVQGQIYRGTAYRRSPDWEDAAGRVITTQIQDPTAVKSRRREGYDGGALPWIIGLDDIAGTEEARRGDVHYRDRRGATVRSAVVVRDG